MARNAEFLICDAVKKVTGLARVQASWQFVRSLATSATRSETFQISITCGVLSQRVNLVVRAVVNSEKLSSTISDSASLCFAGGFFDSGGLSSVKLRYPGLGVLAGLVGIVAILRHVGDVLSEN